MQRDGAFKIDEELVRDHRAVTLSRAKFLRQQATEVGYAFDVPAGIRVTMLGEFGQGDNDLMTGIIARTPGQALIDG